MDQPHGSRELFASALRWVSENYPGEVAEAISIHLRGRPQPIALPLPSAAWAGAPTVFPTEPIMTHPAPPPQRST
ncbi:MAG: hypothetical protein L0Z62_43050 [Gemmataceae bacterium]|nr:hypothetical protein [Gemmataceae bacterium]